MRNFQGIFETRKRFFISAFSISITETLTKIPNNYMEATKYAYKVCLFAGMTALTSRHRLIIKNFVTSQLPLKLSSPIVVNTLSFFEQLLKTSGLGRAGTKGTELEQWTKMD